MQLPGEFRVLLDRRHELRLKLVEGKLGLLLHVLPDALLIGGVPGEACDERLALSSGISWKSPSAVLTRCMRPSMRTIDAAFV